MAMLNVRMERTLREKGNAVLAEMGVTPSQYVRALWEQLAHGDRVAVTQAVAAVMAPLRTSERQAEIDRKTAALKHIDQSFYVLAAELGLDPTTHAPITDEEAAEERRTHLDEKYEV